MKRDPKEKTIRQKWMAVLAKAEWEELEKLWNEHRPATPFKFLRKPETGLVMVRGRAGGKGAAFNAGEATVTRCSVAAANGAVGHAYVLGRNHQHACTAAQIDAVLQDDQSRETVMTGVIARLEALNVEKRQRQRSKVAATKVDFFTLVRGED